jgi:hypothetical protein
MPLAQEQVDWLRRFTRGAVPPDAQSSDPNAEMRARLDADELKCQALKEVELAKSIARIESIKETLRSELDLSFDVDGKATRTRDPRGQDHGFDTMESGRVTTPMQERSQPTQFGRKVMSAMNAMKPLADESERLRAIQVRRHVTDEATKTLEEREVPLFSDQEIMRDFYTPLVREQIVPETFVPDRYSATKRMIDASNDYYIEACKAKGQEPDAGIANFAKGVVDAASSAVQAGLGEAGDAGLITQGVALAIGSGVDLAVLAADAYEQRSFDQDAWRAAFNGLAGAVGKIAGGIQDDVFGGDFYGQMVSAGVQVVSETTRIGRWRRGTPFPAKELIGDILGACTAAAGAYSDKTAGAESTAAASTAAAINGFSTTLQGAIGTLQGLGRQPPATWSKVIAKVLLQATAEGAKAYADASTAADLNSRDPAPTTRDINLRIAVATREKEAIDQGYDSAAKLLEAQEAEAKTAHVAAEAQEIATAQEQIEAERAAFRASLDRLDGIGDDGASDDDLKSIAKLIAKIEKDRLILNMAVKVGALPAAAAEHFFAPLKAAGALTRFAINLHAAIERWSALTAWTESHQDALAANSPYATSIRNFVGNQGDQFLHSVLQGALQGLQAVSAVAEAGYPPLMGLTMGLKGAGALEDAIFRFAQKQKLRQAWKVTQEALANPGNRKLGLIGRKMNPTLAKYSIAYGAVIERDPIAVTAMNRCGLDLETLSQPSANVALVKRYLQALYSSDGDVVGPVAQAAQEGGKPKPPKPELTQRSWALTIAFWRRHESLAGDPPRRIRMLLNEAKEFAEVDRGALPDDDARARHLAHGAETFRQLEDEFRGYVPRNDSGDALRAAAPVLAAYADLAGAEAALLDLEANGGG